MGIKKFVLATGMTLLVASSVHAQTESYEVEADVVAHEMTQDIHVWYPASDGDFPVVYAMHGLDRTGEDWDVVGPALAAHGVVVFAPDYRAADGIGPYTAQDLECGYRYVREIAGDYGGDLSQPLVFLGHSLGAVLAPFGGLDTTDMAPGESFDLCFSGAPRPDAIVAIAGCYYEYEGERFSFDPAQYGTGDARLVLVGGEDDEICATWQVQDAADAFAAAGRRAEYIEIPGANHMAVIARDYVDGEEAVVPDAPAAAEVVQLVLEVIDGERDSD